LALPFHWPDGRCCAVSLTYDDALRIHYEFVGPRLEAHGLRGTFYLHIAADPIENPAPWRELAERGHELGNHSLFHPCRRSLSRRRWLNKAFDLRDYTPLRFQLEVRAANGFLHLLDGKTERTYAITCGDTRIGRCWNKKRVCDLIRNDFVAARGTRVGRTTVVSPSLDLMNVGSSGSADGRTFDDLRDEVCKAREQGGWLIYVIHGVGRGTHPSFVEKEVHEQLLSWLACQSQIWVRPFIDVANWIREWQQGK